MYANRHKRTKSIALSLADRFFRDGLTAELADADAGSVPPPADYEAVVIGSSVRFGRNPHSVIEYIVHSRDALAAMPAFFFSVAHGPASCQSASRARRSSEDRELMASISLTVE